MSGDETPEQTTPEPAGPEPTATTPAAEKPTQPAGTPAAVASPEPADATMLIAQHEHRAHKPRRWGEFLAFALLAVILVGSIFVVAVASPIIFDRIVPAVLGWETFPAAETAPEGAPDSGTDAENDNAAPGAGGRPENGNNNGAGDTPDTGANPDAAPAITATQTITAPDAAPAPAVITHTVSTGETLFQISRQYSVTVEAIVAANNIFNPDLIAPGDVLTIPTE